MNRATLRTCREYARERQTFKGSNLFAEQKGSVYVVYSYGKHWPLFAYVNGEWFENFEKFSRTTSRHRSMTHPHCETLLMSCDQLNEYIELHSSIFGWRE